MLVHLFSHVSWSHIPSYAAVIQLRTHLFSGYTLQNYICIFLWRSLGCIAGVFFYMPDSASGCLFSPKIVSNTQQEANETEANLVCFVDVCLFRKGLRNPAMMYQTLYTRRYHTLPDVPPHDNLVLQICVTAQKTIWFLWPNSSHPFIYLSCGNSHFLQLYASFHGVLWLPMLFPHLATIKGVWDARKIHSRSLQGKASPAHACQLSQRPHFGL